MLKKQFLRFSAMLMALAFWCVQANAQTKTITGSVTDSSGSPVVGVTIKVKDGPQSAVTNMSGEFTINIPATGATLQYSHVTYEYGEVNVTGDGPVNIVLTKLNMAMDEVVVIGYGTQKRSNVTTTIASIKASEIQDVPSPNIAGALRGRIAGLGVSQASGRPGASISLNIRNSAASEQAAQLGITSEPLYIIDGITVSKDAFDNIDPSVVEDITILKDAGSAAIYGAAGANGVVLITTKRGKVGKTKLSYNGYLGVSDATRLPGMMSAYEQAKALNDGYLVGYYDESDIISDSVLNYLKTLPNGTWLDQLWQSSLLQRHNLTLSGGSENMTYFVGGSFQNENGNYAG
ncbi:MAG: TonB-dependent receptor plug domain-containing protein, partial [Niabella sp.]